MVEVTREMIEAGQAVLDRASESSEIQIGWTIMESVKDIYLAMDAVRPRQRNKSGDDE